MEIYREAKDFEGNWHSLSLLPLVHKNIKSDNNKYVGPIEIEVMK